MKPKVAIIVGSVRKNRFAEKAARWIHAHAAVREDVDAELLDLVEYPMPFLDDAMSPARRTGPAAHEGVERWRQKIAAAAGFVVVTPEYNHGYPGVLKNALDHLFAEWNRKPVTFVAYGNAGGARAVEQLRLVAIELDMVPVRRAVHLPREPIMAHFQGGDVEKALAASDAVAKLVLDELAWWTKALAAART